MKAVGNAESGSKGKHVGTHRAVAVDDEVRLRQAMCDLRSNLDPEKRSFFLAHAECAADDRCIPWHAELQAQFVGACQIDGTDQLVTIDAVVDHLDRGRFDIQPLGVVVGAGAAVVAQDYRRMSENSLVALTHEAFQSATRIVRAHAAGGKDNARHTCKQSRNSGGEAGAVLPGMHDLGPAAAELGQPECDRPDHIGRE